MSVNAVHVESVTVNPSKVRYSLTLDHLGDSSRGWLHLQRSEKREDGTWLDDPRTGSRKTVPMISGTAVDDLVALILSLAPRLGITDAFTDYRLQLLGKLSDAGVLDVIVVLQAVTAKWVAKSIPSLTSFLANNQDIAPQITTAWNALDAAIDAANAREQWL